MQFKQNNPQTFLTKLIIACVFIFNFSQPSFGADDAVSTSEAVDQIQKTLLFSNKEEAEKKSAQRKAITIDRSDKEEKALDIEILITDPKNNSAIEQKQKLAYNSASAGQYEVAVELYKQILKSDPKNHYAKFALASSYHMLGQYKQAKTLYYQLLKNDWDDEKTQNELIGNLISVIVEESPNDAVYILAKLSSENPSSAYIMAGAAMAYDKINQPDQAILLLKRAINIDPQQVKYKFNLAIIYDKTQDYQNALNYYQDVVKNYISSEDIDNSIPITQVKQRIEFIKNKI
jgi:tetratricopeptide (TPR) repeat protein